MMCTLTPRQKSGLAMLLILYLGAWLVSQFSSFNDSQQDLSNVLMPPNWQHCLGTDQYGRSMLVRLAEAIKRSFGLSILCVLSASLIGTFLGILAAWRQGWLAHGIDLICNILLALPGLVIVLLLSAIAPGSFLMLYFAIALVQWIEYYRVVKTKTQVVLASPRVEASKMMGFSNGYLFKRHIWPELSSAVLTLAAFGGANSVLMMATLGFVYVGLQPPVAELGLMSVELFPYYQQAPWLLIQPLVLLSVLVFSFHLLGACDE